MFLIQLTNSFILFNTQQFHKSENIMQYNSNLCHFDNQFSFGTVSFPLLLEHFSNVLSLSLPHNHFFLLNMYLLSPLCTFAKCFISFLTTVLACLSRSVVYLNLLQNNVWNHIILFQLVYNGSGIVFSECVGVNYFYYFFIFIVLRYII